MASQLDRCLWTPFSGGVALDCRNGVKLWKLVHSHYTLCVLHRGRADWKYRQRHFSVAPGAIYVCEPGEVHETSRVYCPGDFTVLFLDPSAIRNLGLELGIQGDPHFRFEGVADPEMLARFARFRSLLGTANNEPVAQELVQLTSKLLLSAGPNVRLHSASQTAVGKARQLLEDQFRADPTHAPCLRSLAQHLGVPYHSLVHGFSKHYSVAPYEFVSSMRAQQVFSELRRGPSNECPTLTSVAHKWGYADSSHLARAFRRHFGATPSALARQINPTWKRLKPQPVDSPGTPSSSPQMIP
jgi:AraC-like DNA-binding protein